MSAGELNASIAEAQEAMSYANTHGNSAVVAESEAPATMAKIKSSVETAAQSLGGLVAQTEMAPGQYASASGKAHESSGILHRVLDSDLHATFTEVKNNSSKVATDYEAHAAGATASANLAHEVQTLMHGLLQKIDELQGSYAGRVGESGGAAKETVVLGQTVTAALANIVF